MERSLIDQIESVYIHRESLESPIADRAKEMFGSHKVQVVNEKPMLAPPGPLSSEAFERSKKNLYLAPHKGSFFKQCPGAGGMVCCNYFVLNLGLQCNMNCSYCYLQSYINTPLLTIYTNIDDALRELETLAKCHPDQPYRVGTGETTDSLSLDDLTLYSVKLIEFFKKYPRWNLEFKTKSSKVDQFLELPHSGNVIVSWSVNAPLIVDREEHDTASLKDRLGSARRVKDKGFKVAFHIDPMVWHEGWRDSYRQLVESICNAFDPSEVPSITVGALRFQPEQRLMMKERFGMKSLVLQGEMFQTKEGKLRYDQSLRNEMFNFIMAEFRSRNPAWKVWLCMENSETWAGTFSEMPTRIPELKDFFKPLPKKGVTVKEAHS